MTYHITQEQALEIANEKGLAWTDNFGDLHIQEHDFQAFVNAVLDKVLCEPVGEVSLGMRGQNGEELTYVHLYTELPAGTKLYAPKELP